MNTNNK